MTTTKDLTNATPIREYKWTDDFSYMREMTCKNHPTALYMTKNPYQRSIHIIQFAEGMTQECACPFDDLMVLADATPAPRWDEDPHDGTIYPKL